MYTKGTPTLSTKNTTIKHLKHIGKRKETRSIHPLNKRFGEWKLSHQEQREKRPEAFTHLIKDLGNESFTSRTDFSQPSKLWAFLSPKCCYTLYYQPLYIHITHLFWCLKHCCTLILNLTHV
ncbi:hypothetical protein ACJW31_11G038100 [Castanea mollissima]